MPVEIRRRTKPRRRWSMISAIVVSLSTLQLHNKTPTRATRRYLPMVHRHAKRNSLLELVDRRETNRHFAAPTMNLRCNAGDKPFTAAVTAPDPRRVLFPSRLPVLLPARAELRTSNALRALASTTVATSERPFQRRRRRHFEASLLPLLHRPPLQYPQRWIPSHQQRLLSSRQKLPHCLSRPLNNQQRRRRQPTTVTILR